MRTFSRVETAGIGVFLVAALALVSCQGSSGGAIVSSESVYTPLREGQAVGPLPPEPIPYYPYQPQEIRTLDELPGDVRAKAENHLRERVGVEFYGRLHFVGGQLVDATELHRVNPASRHFRTEIPAYLLRFGFELPQFGIRRYTASLGLRRDGSVSQEVDLPAIAVDPRKIAVKPLAQVSAGLALPLNRDTATVTFIYDRKSDRFLWHFEEVVPSTTPEVNVRTTEIDACTGLLVRRP